ncbi:MAG: desulfoferrodoxin [Planctomycetota bacterium]|jgi:superoxide reductase|nr:desulfoferrodoxin [Planctomycetota bacterium]
MAEPKFYRCELCGNLVGLIHNGGGPLVCCGKPMTELKANTTDAAQEKHVPVVERRGDELTVKVGSVPHPMTAEHSIQWLYVQTANGGQRRNLAVGAAPEAKFNVAADQPTAVYEYCNLHGLWKKEIA